MNQNKIKVLAFLFAFLFPLCAVAQKEELFPDGMPISDWFRQYETTDINTLGKHYRITDYEVVADSTLIQTEQIQAIIDQASQAGGGVIVIPKGTFLSGSLFFKPNTHLHLEADAVLKGSDDISNFAITTTRIEGQTVKYFSALVNADKVNGFTISGKGTIDGNGLRYWKSFWLRRQVNPKCTNMDEMRPRLVYISNSNDVQISGVKLMNSPFWTTHLYKCENVKLLGVHISSPKEPVKAPSSDGIDIDVCKNVLVKNCYISVNDDGVALKGGKGPLAHLDADNGSNRNIIIEDCTYGFCHSVLTCGSESIHNQNIILRRIQVDSAQRLFWLKMRPDTRQNYECILLEDITGSATNMVFIQPWTQFFDMKGETEVPVSYSSNVTLRNINFKCDNFFNVGNSDQYELSNFTFENLNVEATKNATIHTDYIKNFKLKNVTINGKKEF